MQLVGVYLPEVFISEDKLQHSMIGIIDKSSILYPLQPEGKMSHKETSNDHEGNHDHHCSGYYPFKVHHYGTNHHTQRLHIYDREENKISIYQWHVFITLKRIIRIYDPGGRY